MRHHAIWLFSGLLWLTPMLLTAQGYEIGFQSGTLPSYATNLPTAEKELIFNDSEYRGNYYLVIQFDQIPDSAMRQSLAIEGIELFDYIPNYAYLSKVPVDKNLGEIGARALAVYEGQYKLSAALASGNYPSYAYDNGALRLLIAPWPGIAADTLAADLSALGYTPTSTRAGQLRIDLPTDELHELANHPGIQYVSTVEPDPKKEGWIGRAAHRVNRFGPGPGLHYDGTGVGTAAADDGMANHIDKKGRLTDLTGGIDYGDHADMTTGLLIGAGNLHPDYKGFAPGATLRLYYISNYPHISNAISNYLNYGTIITSTSFGEGCGGLYSATAQMIDEQVYNRPELLHFFSAGNSSNSGCSPMYGAFNYGNITGGRKAAKNVFAIANLLYDDNRVASSSRGPAEDGRTKPDLSGFGQGSLTTGPNNSLMTGSGTSAAAPSVAGVAALLVEAFRDLNNQQDPTADIIKALMLNTAEDLGRVGPDFDFGWGRVHAVRALECLQQNQYVRNTIYQGGTKDITINVPANTEQADIMLYWTDAKGSPVAAKALVNDLELEVLGPNGQTHLPWKLSTVAHPDSLTKPAYKGRDHINNMEQVTIHTPTAGTYTIRVSSYVLPSLAQDYVVTYSFTKDEIEVTFPHDEAALVPGENAVIRWDAVGNSGNFIVEYAVGNGSWNTVSSAVPGNRRHLDWIVPDIASANVRVRVRRGNHSDTSDGTFTVVGVPQVSAQTVVANSVKLSWPAVPGATEYEVFKLGDQYMEPVQTTTAADITLSAQPGQKHWYAVRAGITGQGYGKRSLAVPHTSYDCDENVQLVLNFDLFPAETSWSIKDQNGDELVSGGPYHNEPPQSTKQIDICLPYGCFDFTIFDTHNDGICCDDGNGSYQIVAADGDILVSGGIFAAQETKPFCIDNSGPPPLTISVTDQQNVSCHGFADGSVTVSAFGGNGNYSYLWSDGNVSPSRSNLPAGNYTVTVSDGTQQTVLSVAIIQPAPLTINLISTPPDCIGNSNGSIYAVVSEGSESQYTYAWSNGSNGSSISGLSAGTYAVTVTNSNGCTATQSTLLSSPSPIIADISSTPASCSTAEDGSISLENISGGTGNYSIVWSNGATTPTVTGLSPGNYGVTITDSNSCQASATVSISQPEPLAVEVTANAPMGDTLGNASTNTYGGTPPYNYNWSNGATGNTVGALEPGSYSLTVTDANNCTTSSSFTIEDPAIEVCESRGSSTQYEWIDSIAIGNFSHQSGNNGGSADFREDSTLWVHLEPGIPYDLTLVAGFNSSSFNEHWRIWIDFNQDGIFDDSNEEVLAPASSGQPVQGSISLPDTLADGAYAMRISMRYGSPPQACQSFPYGEVEDYLVIVEQVPEYCPSYALSSSSEWIASASFNGQAFDSGNDAGYGDYTDSLLTFAAGSTVQFELSPGFSLNTAPENWQIFIDFDGDGSFSVADERVYVRNDHPYAFSGSFVIPADVTTGNRRMRIVMSFDEEAPPCGSYVWGETEDYTVQLLPATNDGMEERTATAVPHNNWETEFSPGLLRVYPNPLRDRVFADLLLPKDGMLHYQLYNSAGQLLLQRQLELAAGRQQLNIPMASLPSGTYILSIRTLTEHWKRKLIKR